jgi:hypothetical protein
VGDSSEVLRGQRREGGRLTVARFDKILGLSKAPPAFRVKAVAWVDDHIEVTFGNGRSWRAVVSLVERTPEAGSLATGHYIAARYDGDALPERLTRIVAHAVRVRLADISLARLGALLLDDPEIGPVLPVEAAPTGADRTAWPPANPSAPSGRDTKLGGQRRAGGKASMARFAHFLGIDEASAPYTITAIGWIQDRVEILVALDAERIIQFAIHARTPDARGLVMTEDLLVSYQSKDLPEELAQLITRKAPGRLAGLTMETLAGELLADPELGKPGLSIPSADHEHPANQLDTWGGSDAYADFFAGGEMARSQLDSINVSKFSRNVQHCDNECLLVNPHGMAQVATLVDFPWENRIRNVGAPPNSIVTASDPDWSDADSMVATDLNEQDVILGNPGKLRTVLAYVTSLPNPKHRPLFVANTCVPTVIGEDVESVVREFREQSSSPILYLTVTPKSMNDVFVDLLVRRRQHAETGAGAPNERAINLLGFPDSRAVRECLELIRRLGITVNTMLLPDLELDRIDRLPSAALNVFYPNSLWNHLYDQLKLDSRTPHISPPAPYGIGGTRRWAGAIAAALDLRRDFEEIWAGYFSEYEAEWRARTEQAVNHRLALVVRGEEIHYLLDPAQSWGIPLVEMLHEAGFGLDLLLGVRDERAARRVTEQVLGLLPPEHRHVADTFASFDSLRERLSSSKSGAVLSNHCYDWRITEAGKGRFALQHFEIGVPGALRTIDRLVQICTTPFYHKYHKYLARTFEGLRAGAAESID